MSYNFTSNDLDLYKCVVVKLNGVSSSKSNYEKKNSIGVRFRRKAEGMYDATIELVEANKEVELIFNKSHEESAQVLDDLGSNLFVNIEIKEPNNLNLVKLNQKVVLECTLLLSDGK